MCICCTKSLFLSSGTIEDPHKEEIDWSPLIEALKLLPKAHYNVLKYLIEHLHRLAHVCLCTCVYVCVL